MSRRYFLPISLALGGLVIAATVLVAQAAGVTVGHLTRDAASTADVPPYTGAIAAFNAMVWFGTGALAAFVAWTSERERRRLAPFALLAFVLAADDALLLHDSVGPHVGVDEKVFYAVYALTAFSVAVGMRGADSRTGAAFWSGAVLLAASAVVDVSFIGQYLLEDGAKLLGALAWATVPVLAHSAGGAHDRVPPARGREIGGPRGAVGLRNPSPVIPRPLGHPDDAGDPAGPRPKG